MTLLLIPPENSIVKKWKEIASRVGMCSVILL